jgi:hypothetical protein
MLALFSAAVVSGGVPTTTGKNSSYQPQAVAGNSWPDGENADWLNADCGLREHNAERDGFGEFRIQNSGFSMSEINSRR